MTIDSRAIQTIGLLTKLEMVTSEINTAIFFVPDDAILGDNEEITHLGFRKEFIFSYLLILILELYRIINELLEYILKLLMQLKKIV